MSKPAKKMQPDKDVKSGFRGMLTGLQSVTKDMRVWRNRTGVSPQLMSNEFMEINRKASQLLALFFLNF